MAPKTVQQWVIEVETLQEVEESVLPAVYCRCCYVTTYEVNITQRRIIIDVPNI